MFGEGATTIRITAAYKKLLFLAFVSILLVLVSMSGQFPGRLAVAQDKEKIDPKLEARYKALSGIVSSTRIAETIGFLSSPEVGSRVVGYPGSQMAADYVVQQFREIGLEDVKVEEFDASVPMDRGSVVEFGGRSERLHPIWPNMVRTSQTPAEGVTGPLVYIGQATLQDMAKKQIEGSIVLIDFNCSNNWMNAMRGGARAVLFLEPETTSRGESDAKFLNIPVNLPRFWVPSSAAPGLLAAAQSGQTATVKAEVPWVKTTGRNILAKIPGTDPELKDQIIVLSAYYDSMSVAPSLAPGAESATSIAGLLELARVYKQNPPKRTVWLLAADGHYLGLLGVRNWLDQHIDNYTRPGIGERMAVFFSRLPLIPDKTIRPRQELYLFAGLDITSRSEGVGVFYKGHFYDFREDIKARFSDIGTVSRENAARASEVLGREPETAFADGINDIGGKNWRNYLPGKVGFDAEVFSLAGGVGVTFSSLNDARPFVDTPFDTIEKINVDNITTQVKLLACIIDHFLQDPTQEGRLGSLMFPVREPNALTRIGIQGGLSRVAGQVVEYDPRKSFVPNQPVGNSISVLRSPHKSFMGVRANLFAVTDDKGHFSFPGVAPVTAYGGKRATSLAAYKLDETTGDIRFAPDVGAFGGEFNYTGFEVATGSKEMPVIVFPCVATSVFDLVDPQSLRALGGLQVLDGTTDGSPRTYGTAVAEPEPMVSRVEDGAVIFTEPDMRIKLLMSAGPAATRLILINATPENPEGTGYPVGQGTIITNTAYRTAKDIYTLNDFRISRLARYRIINEGLNKLHTLAKAELDLAEKALASKDFVAFEAHSRSAWGFAVRAYPDVQKTASDVVRGSLFYMALLLPFAFFLERLFFGWADLTRQLTTAGLIFITVTLGFSRIHPAFEITLNPLIVILAFVMLALSFLVIFLVSGKFEEQLRALNRQMSGVHKVDIGRVSVAAAAFSLGVSNMRRRKARTVLTCISLVLVTFIVLSFTSIVNEIRFNARPTDTKPTYNGIMLRTAMWEPLQAPGLRILNDEFGRKSDVAPRSWFYGATMGEQSFLTVTRQSSKFDARAIVGLTPQESEITRPQQALVAGRWFEEGERNSVILPSRMATELKVTNDMVGAAKVQFAGIDLTVIGIYDRTKFDRVVDLDGEPLTPVDFVLMQKTAQSDSQSMSEAGFREYRHMDSDTVFILPYDLLMDIGGELRSIGINFVSPEEVQANLNSLMPRLGLNLYAGKDDITYRYSSIGGSSTQGFATILIPIIIAALSVLKTMLDSVYERVREIGIFSSIGLAPNHIAMLFFAEATVYGILGAVSGYLIGQGVSKFLAETGYLAGLTLNFSSMSAVLSTMLVMVIVWLSTFYPARKASQVATPAVDRSWKVPEPEGDEWKIPLPFSVTGEQAKGMNSFLQEWLQAYEEYSVGDFVTQEVVADVFENEYGTSYGLNCKAWLAPFDLGVSQSVRLETTPTAMEDVFEIHVIITRLSGDISNWKRVNRRFLNTLRKQFLIWRTLRAEERDKYITPLAAGAPHKAASEPA